MNYAQLINSDSMRNYFGSNYIRWRPELEALVSKKSIAESDIKDTQAHKKILQTIKFSWLGLFLAYYWSAYHNDKYWLPMVSFFSALNVFDLLILGGAIPTVFFLLPCVIYAMYGKSYILAAKAEEIAQTGKLEAPSWSRVLQAIAIFLVPPVLAILLLDTIV